VALIDASAKEKHHDETRDGFAPTGVDHRPHRYPAGPDRRHPGRLVVFASEDSAVVAGDTNNVSDVFLRDLAAGRTYRVSVSATGTEADTFSADPVVTHSGRYVAFTSYATNLVGDDTNTHLDVFVRDVLG
jgi:hypothetical protein